jgi:anaphase-promoting complex subunit 1
MDWQRKIGKFLISLCLVVNDGGTMTDFLQHYENDLGSDFSCAVQPNPVFLSDQTLSRSDLTSFVEPPCFLSSIEKLIRTGIHGEKTNFFFCDKPADVLINDAFSKMQLLRKTFSALFDESADHSSRVYNTAMVLVNEGYDDFSSLEDHFPIGISVPVIEALLYCRRNPDVLSEVNASLPPAAWRLIGREDVKHQVTMVKTKVRENATSPFQGSFNIAIDEDKDGIVSMEHRFQMLFPRDNRLHEVGNLLRSSRPTFLKVQRAVEVSDHDFERMKQERLLVLCRRVQALPLGRGMFTLGSLEPIPAEPLEVPKLCLAGRVPPNNATLLLDTETLGCPKNMTVWPEFHNGAGLRLPLAYDDGMGKVPMISRAWIVSNRNSGRQELSQRNPQRSESNNESTDYDKHPTHAHGGVLMALGLRGHLSALSMTDIYEYLTQGSVTTSVGILLGMSATKRGSCDPAVSKMLCLHIPSLLPASFSSIDVSGPAHAAAVTGIGLLYQGSSHRLMTEFLLNEMGRRPTQDANTKDREAYALSCGLSLGMVNLAQGDATESLGGGNAGLADLDIELRLNRYVVGGIDTREERRRQAFDGQFAGHNDGERCSRINEGDTINNDVTAPGATLALGLMYLKSG